MNDIERMRLLDEARATVERTAHIGEPSSEDRDLAGNPARSPKRDHDDRIATWRRGVEKQEAEFAAARAVRATSRPLTDSERAAANAESWDRWFEAKLAPLSAAVGIAVGQLMAEQTAGFNEAIEKRDQRIGRLEVSLVRAEAVIARMEARLLEAEIARDREREQRELPPASALRRVN
jgi:hypothetical protein